MAKTEIFNCDCLEYMRSLPDKAFSLAICDPPYRDENDPFQQMRATSSNKEVFTEGRPSEEFFEQLKRISENQIIFGANNFGYEFKGFIAWDKLVRGSDRYSQVEIASLSEGLSTVSTLVQISVYQKEEKFHPTTKPVELYGWLLKRFAKEGDTIFDPMAGSGSSRIAAYKLGFDWTGCEIDKDYYEKSIAWFNKECLGEWTTKNGNRVKEQSLFDW